MRQVWPHEKGATMLGRCDHMRVQSFSLEAGGRGKGPFLPFQLPKFLRPPTLLPCTAAAHSLVHVHVGWESTEDMAKEATHYDVTLGAWRQAI